MNKSISTWIFISIIVIIILAACGGPGTATELAGTSWKLVSYGAVANPTPAIPEVNATLTFDVQRLSGNAGCNSFGGDYNLSGSEISFGQIVSTMMACQEPLRMQQEQAVLHIFSGTARLNLENNRLTITSSDGIQAVTFVQVK